MNPKVFASALAGAATLVLVYVASLFGVDVPPEVASAVTVLFSSAAGYLKRDAPRGLPAASGPVIRERQRY
jgi:hypothetical protein